jgi:heptaprenylglyceryl phosphate synthase
MVSKMVPVFSHTWKIDPKDKHTQKQACSYTNSYVEMFVIVYGTQGRRERKRE